MSTITSYSPTCGRVSRVPAAAKWKGLFQRFVDRMIAARMRRAETVLRQHSHLIPRELEEQAGWKLTQRSEDSLPFIR
jgi:hypothetical protein